MLSFGPPLPVGLTSSGEYLDVFTAYHYTGNIVRDLGTFLPKGLRITAARPIARENASLGRIINLARYDVTLPKAFAGDFAALVERARGLAGVKDLLPSAGHDRNRLGDSGSCPKPPATIVVDLAIEPGIKLFDALAGIFKISDTEARSLSIRRRDCLVAQNGRIRTPLED